MVKMQKDRSEFGDLPVHGVAVNNDRQSLLGGRLAEALHEYKDSGGLRVMQPSVVAHHHVVEQDVDVGDFVRVERCHDSICVGDLISLGSDQLQGQSHLDNFHLLQGRATHLLAKHARLLAQWHAS